MSHAYTGDLGNIQINARDFEPGSSHVLEVSFSVDGMTSQTQRITFAGMYTYDVKNLLIDPKLMWFARMSVNVLAMILLLV